MTTDRMARIVPAPCPGCGGIGRVDHRDARPWEHDVIHTAEGSMMYTEECPWCGGWGVVPQYDGDPKDVDQR